MTTNLWINNIMKDIPSFIGVYSLDNVKQPECYPSYTIINFSPSRATGTHFITVLFISKLICVYFDPLNLIFIPQEIKQYMVQNSNYIYLIDYPIQNLLSGYCGFFCILVILFAVNQIPIYEGLRIFPKMSLQNDNKCIDVLVKLFKIYYLELKEVIFKI